MTKPMSDAAIEAKLRKRVEEEGDGGHNVFTGALLRLIDEARAGLKHEAVPMLLWCPGCNERHIDVGEFATKNHHTHACQHCGMTWRPAICPTVGVRFLPGFKDEEEAEPTSTWWRHRRCGYQGDTGGLGGVAEDTCPTCGYDVEDRDVDYFSGPATQEHR